MSHDPVLALATARQNDAFLRACGLTDAQRLEVGDLEVDAHREGLVDAVVAWAEAHPGGAVARRPGAIAEMIGPALSCAGRSPQIWSDQKPLN